MTYQPQPGDIGLSGVKAQGVVSIAIKLGSVLRHEKTAGRTSLVGFLFLPLVGLIAGSAAGVLGAIVGLLVGIVAAVTFVVIVAAIWGFASKNKTWFSHSFIVHHLGVNDVPWITESVGTGACTTWLHYAPGGFVWLKTSSLLGRDDADEMRAFLDAVTAARWKYDYGTFAGLAIYSITGAMLAPAGVGTAICSGLTSEALTRGKAIWPLPAYRMMPQDQYWWAVQNGIEIVTTG